MRSSSLCLEAPGSCAAQFIESERHTAANTCVMPATPATRNVRSVASRGQGPLAASAETPDKAGKLMLLAHPIGSDGRIVTARDLHRALVRLPAYGRSAQIEAIPEGVANGSKRPSAALRYRPDERAVSTRKRSSRAKTSVAPGLAVRSSPFASEAWPRCWTRRRG